jgi:site-specific DNA-methyltransferase (adenine-specific)
MPNQIIQGDCLKVMAGLEDNSVGMVFADLPYGVTACHWDKVIDLAAMWVQFKRLIQAKRACVFTATQPFTTDLICSNRDWFRYEWIWEKNYGTNFASTRYQPMKQHENVLVFGRGTLLYNPQRIKRTESGISRAKYPVNPSNTGKRKFIGLEKETIIRPPRNDDTRCPSSVLKFNMETGRHPTQKPVALVEYLIRTYTNPGDVVLDPTCGSGTTAIAAMNTGRGYICIEKDPDEYRKGLARVEEHLAKPVQFDLLDSAPAIARAAPPPQLSIFDTGVKA